MNRRFGTGGASRAGGLSIRPGLGRSLAAPVLGAPAKEGALFGSKLVSRGVCKPAPTLDLWEACVRHADAANHNPPAASSVANARNRRFAFMFALAFKVMIHSRSRGHCARISGSWLSIWNEDREFWCEAPGSRNEPGPSLVDYALDLALRSTPTAALKTQKNARVKQLLEIFPEMESPGSTGIPVSVEFRESDASWDSSFRSSARPRSRP